MARPEPDRPNLLARLWRNLAALGDLPRLRRTSLHDARWYLDTYADLAGMGTIQATLHYLSHGAREGRDPGPGFSTSGYQLQRWKGQNRGTQNPLLHHLSHPRAFAPLPVFAGTGGNLDPAAPVVMFCAHQVQGMQFGAERSFLTLLERAGQAGLGVEVVLPQCLDAAYLAACRARARAVRLIPYGWRRAGHSPHPATLAALVAALRDSGARELHQNTLVCDAPLIAARQAGVPNVVHLRELPEEDPALCARMGMTAAQLRGALHQQADRFIANSEATAQWIDPEDHVPPLHCVILPNQVDAALFALPFAPAPRLRAALIGSNVIKKGIADARAVALACARMGLAVDVRLIGPMTADLAALGPLPANMRHAGYVPDPVQALEQTDIVLSLSHFAESFGRTLLEAMAAGRPVIAYDRGTPPALIGPEAGRIVPADDPQAVADALRGWVMDRAALHAASEAGRARARLLQAQACAVPAHALFAAALRP